MGSPHTWPWYMSESSDALLVHRSAPPQHKFSSLEMKAMVEIR